MSDQFDVNEILAGLTDEQKLQIVRDGFEAMKARRDGMAQEARAGVMQSGDWVSNINRQAAEILKEEGVDLDFDSPEYGRFIKPHESGNPDDYLKGTKRYSSVRKATARLEQLQAKGLSRTLEERQEARRLVEEINRLEREGK